MTKKIIEAELEDLTYHLEDTLGELRSKADELIHRWGTDARIDISVEHAYGSEYVRVSLRGKREETDGEYHKRLAEEARIKEIIDERDRKEYERLKAKFKE